MYFLRFTADPDRDLEYGCSLWVDWNQDDPDENPDPSDDAWIWVDYFECWCRRHSGLSGHALEAETMEGAVAEVLGAKNWFANPHKDSWAIFEGDFAREQDTPEGHSFKADSVAYFQEAAGKYNASL